MQNFDIGDEVYYKANQKKKGIVVSYNFVSQTYKINFGNGYQDLYDIQESDLNLVKTKSKPGPELKIGDCVYHTADHSQVGIIKRFDSHGYAEVVSHNITNTYRVGNLKLTKTQPECNSDVIDSVRYAMSNTLPETSQHIVCECGVDSAGAGGLHANYCRKVVQ